MNKSDDIATTTAAAHVLPATHVLPNDAAGTHDTVSGNERVGDHGVSEVVGERGAGAQSEEVVAGEKMAWFAYLKTRDFWLVMVLG